MVKGHGVDVVVVGGGIAGGAVATALARGGLSVVLLERSTEYKDRVRGEFLAPWGVIELQRLGLFEDLMAAGANAMENLYGYDEVRSVREAESRAIPLNALISGVPGALGIRHPEACGVMEAAAIAAGAAVVRGVSDTTVEPGQAPAVTYTAGENSHRIECRMIVGADGRDSSVRRQMGITLRSTEARVFMAGMLVDGVRNWKKTDALLGTEGDRMFYAFPQTDSRLRLYLGVRVEQRQRLAGADRVANTLEGFQLKCLPDFVDIAGATPIGPCAAYPMQDTWSDTICSDGVVLVGDAAGFSDPVIGQGLSVALRDARSVAEALLAGDHWSPATFGAYTLERAQRMRRLRFAAQLFTDAHLPSEGGEDSRRARMDFLNGGDDHAFMAQVCTLTGPETAPEESFNPAVRSRLLAAG